MKYVDLERVVALFSVVNPKGDDSIKGVYFNGDVFIACSAVNYVEYRPLGELPIPRGSWFPLLSLHYLKALLADNKGKDSILDDLISGYHFHNNGYPDIQMHANDMERRSTTQTVTLNLKQLVALHRSLTLGLKNSKKEHVTLEFKGNNQPVSVVSFEGNKGLIMPIREGA